MNSGAAIDSVPGSSTVLGQGLSKTVRHQHSGLQNQRDRRRPRTYRTIAVLALQKKRTAMDAPRFVDELPGENRAPL